VIAQLLCSACIATATVTAIDIAILAVQTATPTQQSLTTLQRYDTLQDRERDLRTDTDTDTDTRHRYRYRKELIKFN
jgi:hypothetical protein